MQPSQSNTSKKHLLRRIRICAVPFAALFAVSATAADISWTGATDAVWSTGGNWVGAVAPTAGDVAVFNASSVSNLSNTLGVDRTIQGLKIVTPSGLITIGAGNLLTLGAGGIDMSVASQNLVLNALVALAADQSWNVATGRTLTANGVISGTNVNLNKIGAGDLTLSAANTFTGTTTISGGTLNVTGSLNGTAGTDLTFAGSGTFNVSAVSGVSQGMKVLRLNSGEGTVKSTNNGGTSTVSFTSRTARLAGATGNFVLTGGTAGTPGNPGTLGTNNITIGGGELTAQLLDRGLFFNGSSYAAYDAGGFLRGLIYGGIDANAPASIAGGTTLTVNDATKNVQISGNITAQTTASVNTIRDAGAFSITLAGGQTLSFNGFLKTGGTEAIISGGSGVTATAGGNEMVFRADTSSDTITINTPILANGASSLTKSGAGRLRLTGNSTLSGLISINLGILELGNGTTGLNGTVASNSIVNRGILIFNNADAQTYSGVVSGTGALFKNGAGTFVLAGNNTYSGTTTLNGGVLQINSADNLGNASATNTIRLGAATLQSTANTYDLGVNRAITQTRAAIILSDTGTLTISGAINKDANLLTVGGAGNTTINGVISGLVNGGGGLTKTGTGTLTLTANNTYVSATLVSSGSLLINGSTASGSAVTVTNTIDNSIAHLGGTGVINGAVTISAPAAINRLNVISAAGIGSIGTLTLGGGLTLSAGAVGYFDITNVTTKDFLNITGNLTAASGAIIQVPTGIAANTYALIGYTGTASPVGNFSLQTLAGGAVPPGYFLNYGTNVLNLVVGNTRVWNGGGGDDNWSTGANWDGAVSGTEILRFAGSVRPAPFNNFTAGTIFAGISFDSGAASFTLGGNSIGMAGDILNSSSNNQIINVPMALSRGVGTSVDTGANNLTFGAAISDGSSPGKLIKSGSGTLNLTAANAHTGGNTVNAGTLAVSGSGTLGASAAPLTVDGATSIVNLGGTSQTAGAVTLSNGGQINNGTLTGSTFALSSGSVGASLAGAATTLTKTTASTVTLSVANTFGGATTISAGAINIGHNLALQNTTVDVGINNSAVTFGAGVTAPALGGLKGTGSLTLATATSEAVTITVGGNNATTTFNGALTGAGGLIKVGNGTLTLFKGAVANSYLGATLVSAGTLKLQGLQIANGINASWFSNSFIAQNDMALDGATYNPTTFARSFTGSLGVLAKTPNNSVQEYQGPVNSFITLGANGDNFTTAWSGSFTPNSTGNYRFTSSNDDHGVMYMDINNNGVFESAEKYGDIFTGNFDRSKALTSGTTYNYIYMTHEDGGGETNNWSIQKPGGTLVVVNTAGNADQGGTWTVIREPRTSNLLPITTALTLQSGATLEMDGNDQQIASLTGVAGAIINNNAIFFDSNLNINGTSGSTTFGGVIRDGTTKKITLTKSGASTQILTGANTFTGAVTLSGGTLSVGTDSNLGNGSALVFDGGTLQITGNTLNNFGTHTPTFNLNKTVSFDIADAGNNFVISQILDQGTGGFRKTGPGTLTFNQSNTYTGMTTVDGGTLVLGGSLSGAASINNTGTLTGDNVSVGDVFVNSGGTLSPGINGINTLNTGTVTFGAGSVFKFEIDTATPAIDFVSIVGDLNIVSGAIFNASDLASVAFPEGTNIPAILAYSGAWNGGIFKIMEGATLRDLGDEGIFTIGVNAYQISYNGFDGVSNEVTLTVVPEPGTATFLLGGLGLLLGVRRRRA